MEKSSPEPSTYPTDKVDEDILHYETQQPTTQKTSFLRSLWQKDVDPLFIKEALDKYGEGTAGVPPELEKKLVRKLDFLILPLCEDLLSFLFRVADKRVPASALAMPSTISTRQRSATPQSLGSKKTSTSAACATPGSRPASTSAGSSGQYQTTSVSSAIPSGNGWAS
jgi:hypothetical protein